MKAFVKMYARRIEKKLLKKAAKGDISLRLKKYYNLSLEISLHTINDIVYEVENRIISCREALKMLKTF